jgi:Beta-lactamase
MDRCLRSRMHAQPLQPVTTGTIFQAASLSKPLFAYAVLELVERGDLELDAPLTAYLSAPSDGAHPVRLGQRTLLTEVVVYSNAAMILTKDPAKQRVARTFLEWLLQPPTHGRLLKMEPCLFLPETEDGSTAASC